MMTRTETEATEQYIVGDSDDCEAEYGQSAEGFPFTILSMFDGEIYCVEGFRTRSDAMRSLKEEDVSPSQIVGL